MPGYNHYPWCTCGWCYKHGRNFYSHRTTSEDFDRSFAERRLKECGATTSWSTCFVNPNARCPDCGAIVFFYQNDRGGRVYFDELGWPWPKHPCTDNTRGRASNMENYRPIAARARGAVVEILEAAKLTGFDPNAAFRSRFGQSPWDLLVIERVARLGFENMIEARSISPSLDDTIFISFTSAKFVPSVGNYVSFDGRAISVLDRESFEPKPYKTRPISREQFEHCGSEGRTQ